MQNQIRRIIQTSLLSILVFTSYALSFAQDCPADFLGTKTLYRNPAAQLTPEPAGYHPVFINYVGRHGARHLTKEVQASYAYQLLAKADSLNALTDKGQALKQMVLLLDKVEKGNIKSISAEGRSELQGIGERLFKHNQNVFGKPLNLKVSVTKEIRTKQSADAFLAGLNKGIKNTPAISEVTDDENLRFYDAAPAYTAFEQNGSWITVMSALKKEEKTAALNQTFAERIFKKTFALQLQAAQTAKFTTDIFGFVTILYSLEDEVLQAGIKKYELNLQSVFSCAELAHLGKIDAAEDYLKIGPGTNLNGIQVRIAVPLLINFIKTTDDFIVTGKYNAQLRFAHAETIAPFSALLGISSADKTTKNISELDKVWQPSQVAPLSSNIQWIFYQHKNEKEYLVKVLLNEKEVHITGLSSKTFPYYQWTDLKAFYLKRLSAWHIGLDDDMNKYLKEVAEK